LYRRNRSVAKFDLVTVFKRHPGVGMDPKVEEKLFEASHTTRSDGIGIGL
jgi:signal transduction histidine kinase